MRLNNVELSLSTAQPALGGNLTEIGTTMVEFYRSSSSDSSSDSDNHHRVHRDQGLRGSGNGSGNLNFFFYGSGNGNGSKKTTEFHGNGNGSGIPLTPDRDRSNRGRKPGSKNPPRKQLATKVARKSAPCSGGPMIHYTTEAEEDVLATTFTIPSKKTIPSDSAEHKVTLTIEHLTAQLHHHCVPKKNTNVFLMASVVNDSDYPLISGPATVYLNNSMSTKIDLKSTSCGEKFDVPLGVDKAIKVVYKPKHKFQTQTGMITKNLNSTTEQRIIVKNTKRSEPILITLHEAIPNSTEEKIRVHVISPEIIPSPVPRTPNLEEDSSNSNNVHKLPTIGTKMDDLNNLIWAEKIKAEHETDFMVKWSIDYPPTETLRYYEKFQEK